MKFSINNYKSEPEIIEADNKEDALVKWSKEHSFALSGVFLGYEDGAIEVVPIVSELTNEELEKIKIRCEEIETHTYKYEGWKHYSEGFSILY